MMPPHRPEIPAVAHVRAYRATDNRRATFELVTTMAVWLAGLLVMPGLPWLGVPLVCAGYTRLFSIFHAIGHHAYFESRRRDRIVGVILSVILLTPLGHWRQSHNRHHRVFGDLDADDPGDPILFSCEDYAGMSRGKRWLWRVLRDPWFFFLVVPALRWSVQYLYESRSLLVALGMIAAGIYMHLATPWLLLAMYLTTVSAFVMFHLHHAVDRGYRARSGDHCSLRAALEGSTFIPLPFPLSWCFFGLEYHHIHHLAPAVPSYRMAECHHEAPEGTWDEVTVVTPSSALASLGHTMWSESRRRFARFGATSSKGDDVNAPRSQPHPEPRTASLPPHEHARRAARH